MDSWVLVPCQRSRLVMLKNLLSSLDHPADRTVVVATYPDPIRLLDFNSDTPHVISCPLKEEYISQWWNYGLDYIKIKAQKNHEILVMSSDMVGGTYSVATLGIFLRRHGLTMVGPNLWGTDEKFFHNHSVRGTHDRVPGCCWMLAGESGLRCDTDFRWWFSDDDIEMQARHEKGTALVPYTGLLAGEDDTPLSEEKQQWAIEDRAKFVAKWGQEPW